jgi:hypothetical protein
VGEVIQRRLVGTFQFDGGYRSFAGKNGRVIGLRVDRTVYRLLAQPEVYSTPRVGAFLEHGPGYLG